MTEHAGFDLKVLGPFGAMFEPFITGLDATRIGSARAADNGMQGVAVQLSQSAKAAARCQLEMMGLANRRLQAYMHIPSTLAKCRTPQDLLTEQAGFWRTAFEQYAESTGKVVSIWGDAVNMPAFGPAVAVDRDYINFAEPAPIEERPAARSNGSARPAQQRRVA